MTLDFEKVKVRQSQSSARQSLPAVEVLSSCWWKHEHLGVLTSRLLAVLPTETGWRRKRVAQVMFLVQGQ